MSSLASNISVGNPVDIGSSNSAGLADTLIRSDHTHAVVDLAISGQTEGDILYFDGDNWVRLAAGTSGMMLQTKGSSAAPIWNSPSQGNAIGSTSSPTTTSATYVVIPEMTTTFTTSGGNIFVSFIGTFNMQSNDDFTIGIHLDGSLVVGTEQRSAFFGGSLLGLTPAAITAGQVSTIGLISAVTPGPHTFDVRWKRVAGTARAVSTMRQIVAIEIL